MSDESNHQNLLVGAAVVAGILGTLSALLRSNKTFQGWTEQAKDAASQIMDKGEAVNKNLLLGGVAGGLIGATAALLLAPKPGSELIQDIAHTLGHTGESSTSRKSSSSKARSSTRKSSRSKSASSGMQGKGKRAAKSEGAKSQRSSSSKKKSSSRRRIATAALKTTPSEKATSEGAGSST